MFDKFIPQSVIRFAVEGIVGPFVVGKLSVKTLFAGMSPTGVTLNV